MEKRTHWKITPTRVTYSNLAGTAAISLKGLSEDELRRLALKGLRCTLADRLVCKIPSPINLRRAGIEPSVKLDTKILERVRYEIRKYLKELGLETSEESES